MKTQNIPPIPERPDFDKFWEKSKVHLPDIDEVRLKAWVKSMCEVWESTHVLYRRELVSWAEERNKLVREHNRMVKSTKGNNWRMN